MLQCMLMVAGMVQTATTCRYQILPVISSDEKTNDMCTRVLDRITELQFVTDHREVLVPGNVLLYTNYQAIHELNITISYIQGQTYRLSSIVQA